MDDGNGDQNFNDTSQSDVKQNCVENTNSLAPSSDNCVAKKTSFEITSITEPNNDDNDEDSPDTDSNVQDHKTDSRHDSDLQSYAENIVVYNSSNDLGGSAPVIPTSSQYGLAIVDNSDSNHLGSIKNEDIHGVDASLQKSEGDLNGLQNKNRNERFKVVKIESTEPFKRGRWVCMDFLDHSMNQQQSGNNKLIMVNGENKAFSPANESDNTTEPLDNGQQESTELKVSTNNVSTYTTNCNTTDNYKNQTSVYNIVSSGVTTPIHSACVSPGQSLQTNMQVPVLTSQPIPTPVQAPQPQSLTQVQIPAQHNVNQGCIPHSSLQSHQIQQVISNAGVMQPQLQQTQPVINVMQNQNQSIQPIQHLTSVDQHVTQSMPQYQQPMSQANVQQQIMQQHSMPAQFQKSFVPQNQSILPNCASLQPPVNQIINQQVPQYYNSSPIQSQNVTSESSTTVSMPNQHISQPYQSIPIQNQPLQSHVQLQQNQQQLPPPVQQMQQPSPQQNMVQQNQMQPQMIQQNQQLSHQPSISQPSQPQQSQTVPQQTQQMSQQLIQQTQQTPQSQQTHVQQVTSSQQQGSQQMQQVGQQIQAPQGTQIQQQLPQQTHHITQISQLTNQTQMPQSNQMQQQIAQPNQQIPQQPQQIPLQNQQIPQQAQLQHPKQIQTPQIQSQPQQINQQQIPQQQQISQITGQNQMIHQNNQQITHTGQIMSQQTHNQGQQINQQNQVQQQQPQQPQQQIQQQLTQTSQPSQPITQQILQPNQNMSQQNQVLPQQLGIGQSNSQMSVSQSQNQQVIQPQHMQQSGQQYQQPQQMMQSQPQQLPMQTNQPIMHQPTYSQAQSLSSMQLQQAVMQIPTHTVTSTQMHIQQQQPVVQSNMIQQPQLNVIPQNNNQPSGPGPMSQQQMTYSLQQHVPINQNYANMQNCYIPSQQQNIAPYKPSVKAVETVNKKKEDANSEDVDNVPPTTSGTNTVAIDNKIEQAMDLVKSHLMYAVREEVEVLKEKIAELMDKVGLLETENSNLRMLVPPEMLEQYNREKQKPTNNQPTHNQ